MFGAWGETELGQQRHCAAQAQPERAQSRLIQSVGRRTRAPIEPEKPGSARVAPGRV
jgi:hypothetical protein